MAITMPRKRLISGTALILRCLREVTDAPELLEALADRDTRGVAELLAGGGEVSEGVAHVAGAGGDVHGRQAGAGDFGDEVRQLVHRHAFAAGDVVGGAVRLGTSAGGEQGRLDGVGD